MYPEHLVHPMRMDIVAGGFQELKLASEVEDVMAKPGTTLVFFNSVCGCSASTARPGVKHAVASSAKKPNQLVTVFAGVDPEAVQKPVSIRCLTLLHLHRLLCSKMAS